MRKTRSWLASVIGAAGCGLMLMCFCAKDARAQDIRTYTIQTYTDWLHKYADAKPDFKPGDVLTAKDLERMRPFVPPGMLEQLNFPEFRARIVPVESHAPRKDYIDCTEKYSGQTRLAADGALENYVCGQPFPLDAISVDDPQAGLKAAWNYEWKWQNLGYIEMDHEWCWIRNGGSHPDTGPKDAEAPPDEFVTGIKFTTPFPKNIHQYFGGGGTIERTLGGFYQKTIFTHQAYLNGGSLPIADAKDFEFKEITYFAEPFDIRGTTFIIYRYLDPHRAEESWAYIPTLRRVRRISAEVRSDSLLGTDLTIEDYYGFNGQVLEWNWKFLGWKDILAVNDPKDDYARMYGPNGTIPDDQWSVKKMAVLLRTPKWSRHPYSAAINFWEPDSWLGPLHVVFDRKNQLWKVVIWEWKYSEDFKEWTELLRGVHAMAWLHLSAIDVQNNRATVISGFGPGFPNYPMSQIQSTFDVSRLEQIHR
jgi:Protein of unknown function (DUF1329)